MTRHSGNQQPDTPADVAVRVQENRFSGPVVLTGVIGLGIVLVLVLLVWLSTPGDDRGRRRRDDTRGDRAGSRRAT